MADHGSTSDWLAGVACVLYLMVYRVGHLVLPNPILLAWITTELSVRARGFVRALRTSYGIHSETA